MKFVLTLVIVCLLVPAVSVLAQDPPKPEAKPEKIDVTGTWDMTVESPQGAIEVTTVLKQDGEKITGTQTSQMGEAALEGTVVGNDIKYTIAFDMQGQQIAIVFAGKIEGDAISGIYDFGGMGSGAWSAKKRK